jgi:hypothetical protein
METLTLELKLSTGRLDHLQDLQLSLRFRNRSKEAQTIYPGCAQNVEVGGWGSPLWHMRLVRGESAVVPANLRLYYGPPGMPPNAEYFTRAREQLAPGKDTAQTIHACYLPRSSLPLRATDPALLDPDGMDALAPSAKDAIGVLVLQRSCDELKKALKTRTDALRPGLAFFVGERGRYTFEVRYAQEAWMAFQPESTLQLEASAELQVD